MGHEVLTPGQTIKPGTEIVGFEPITPVADDVCAAQVHAALARNLPEAIERRPLVVVANGPSARLAPLDTRLPTLAFNGALRLFTDRGLAPTYWAACDPQALVADFLPPHPPKSTTYLVASKCHPYVFDRLAARRVHLWHLPDYPAPGGLHQALCPSVTLSGLWLARSLGFTDFDIYGWDCCFDSDASHAGDGSPVGETIALNYGGEILGDDVIGGRNFPTTPTWIAESNAAGQFFQLARYFDLRVTIHGDGMIRAEQEAILGV